MKRCGPAVAMLTIALAVPALAQSVMVGGQAMLPAKNIVQNAVNSADHTTLVTAVKAAGLAETLQTAGPFTVFAPTNAAFAALPAGTVDMLLRPDHKETLAKILTYHVVPGDYSAERLRAMIQGANGRLTLGTVSGGKLTLMMNGPSNIVVHDEKMGTANIVIYDVKQSNGEIFSIDRVLLPSS